MSSASWHAIFVSRVAPATYKKKKKMEVVGVGEKEDIAKRERRRRFKGRSDELFYAEGRQRLQRFQAAEHSQRINGLEKVG